ncbi:unnamed protein product [Spirodela intermedia]|uniref:Uncharacterized protein n=1 Tax=Spirodela intermedia TaxID=51605 RepID=A0ABN7ED89_SPIIN|nr:unnamed protein product [Spirodela intermedia]
MGLLLAAAFSTAVFTRMAAAFTVVPAIYAFGDSTADVGNNNFLPGNQAKANFPPNGIDFPRSRPTGRFSNGYIGLDFMAKKLKFNKSPPAYLSISNDAQAYRGVNFASGGSGIFDATGQNFSISLNQQIKYFKGITRRLRTRISGGAAYRFLSRSLFVFSTGNNDMIGFYVNFGLKNETQQQLFIGQLTGQFRNQLETLYDLGARKFVVFGSSLIGCIPILRLGVPGAKCVEDLNNLSQQFNKATQIVLRDLALHLERLLLLLHQHLRFHLPWFTDIISACCGSGRLNAESECRPNSTYCSNRDEYFFWDQFHPTQASYELISLVGIVGVGTLHP